MPISLRPALVAAALASAAPVFGQTLTLDDAISRAVVASPVGAATTARRDVLAAARDAANTKPAPSIDVLAENFGVGGRELRDQIQIGATWNQRFERGGKRTARVGLAEADLDVAEAEALVRRLDIAAGVQKLYVEVQGAEASLALARERVTIAEQLSREVGRRVSEARDPLFAGTRARTQLAEAKIDAELAVHARDAAMTRLTSLWGGTPGALRIDAASFIALTPVSGTASPAGADLAIYEARRRRATADVTLQRAIARPDPTISAGPRYLGTGDIAVVAGVSLPLANKGLNRANIARAEAEGRQAEADLAVERFQRNQTIVLAAERVEETRHEVEAIREKVLPGAERTLAEVRSGYNRGGFTFLDVSSAQTALHDARARLVRAAIRHHEARAELDRLTGRFATLVQEAR